MEKIVRIPSGNLELIGSLHIPDKAAGEGFDPLPLLIICHGFVGSRIRVNRLFVEAARHFARNGFMVLRFDYAGCGESAGNYGEQIFGDFIQQTLHVLDFAEKLEGVDTGNITLIGHSLGGAVATFAAAHDNRVKSLALWAPVAYPFQDITRIVGEQTYLEARNNRYADYEGYLFTSRFFDSMAPYSPLKEIQSFPGEVLLVHGSSDYVIPSKYSFYYYYQKVFLPKTAGTCEKEIIMGADHTFSNFAHKEKLFSLTRCWLARGKKTHAIS